MIPKLGNDDNPSNDLFHALAIVSLGGLFALILTDRLVFSEIKEGRNLILIALSLVPVIISSISALFFFRMSYSTIEKQLLEREAILQKHHAELERTYRSIMYALVAALDSRDHLASGHSKRVVGYALAIADRLGLSRAMKRDLIFGGYLHDVGKIGVSDVLLRKQTKLSADEWEEMRLHPLIGLQILHEVDFLGGASDVVLYHHERFDGTGYPAGLAAQKIPLVARVFAVADAFDAMTADRPYRLAISAEEARRRIRENTGTQFCPECVNAFLTITDEEFESIKNTVEEGQHDRFWSEYNMPAV